MKKQYEWLNRIGADYDMEGIARQCVKLGEEVAQTKGNKKYTIEVSADPYEILTCSYNTTGWRSCYAPDGEYKEAAVRFALLPDSFVIKMKTTDGRTSTRRLGSVDRHGQIHIYRNYGDRVEWTHILPELYSRLNNSSEGVVIKHGRHEFSSDGLRVSYCNGERPQYTDDCILSVVDKDKGLQGFRLNGDSKPNATRINFRHLDNSEIVDRMSQCYPDRPQTSRWVCSNKLYSSVSSLEEE